MLNVIPKQNRINSVCSNTIFSSGQWKSTQKQTLLTAISECKVPELDFG
jgi:hypothetical protein